MNRQLESMTKVSVGAFTIRVWREETNLSDIDNGDIENMAHGLWVTMRHIPAIGDLAQHFADLPRVAAVEVLDRNGNGVLIYPDWK